MKVVLKSKGYTSYVRVLSPKPGDWETVSDIDQATVFDLELGGAFDKLKITPPIPFDTNDHRDSDRMDEHMLVPVKIGGIEEV